MRSLAQAAIALALLASATPCAAQADISGKWLFALTAEVGSAEYAADLQLNGEQVTGSWAGAKVEGTFRNGRLELMFPFHPPEAEVPGTLSVTGSLQDQALAGEWSWNEYSGSFKATRQP
jgi:hypothetical protein